jgi:hypothetical protein
MNRIRIFSRVLSITLLSVASLLITSAIIRGQCVDHPVGKTAVKFNNETRYDLTFFIDREPVGTFVPSKQMSEERPVPPGSHLLRAMAMVNGKEFWVWVINEIPSGQLCTWTLIDPPREKAKDGREFRTPVIGEPNVLN